MSPALQSNADEELVRLRAQIAELTAAVQRAAQLEARLRFVEARRASHLGHTPLAMIFWDSQFRACEWNPAAERIFGYTEAEALGRHACDLIVSPEVRPHVEQVFRALLQQTGGHRSTNDNVTKCGRRIRCEWYNTPLADDRGQVFGVASIAQDITDQEATARALAQSEDMLRSILENAPDFVVLVDRDRRVTYVNKVAAGYAAESVLGQLLDELVAPEHRAAFVARVDNVLASGAAEELEVRDMVAGRWYYIRIAPVASAERIEHLLVICVDIHERRSHEENLLRSRTALEESEQRFRALAENMPGIVFTAAADADFSTTFVNSVCRKVLGYGPEELTSGRVKFLQCIHPDDLPRIQAEIRAALAARQPYHITYRVRHADGRWIWLEEYTQGILDSDGELRYIAGTAFDITAQRAVDEQLRQRDEMFRVLAQNVPGVVYLCRNDERYSMMFLSDAVEKLVGIPAGEFLADRASFLDLYHPDDATAIPLMVNAALARRAPFHLTYRLRRRDGSYLWAEEYGQGVFDAEGRLQFLEGAIFDVTAKRAAVEALHRSKEELEEQVQGRTQQLRMANRLLRSDYQRQLELLQNLRESEEKFRIMCDANPAPVTIARVRDGEIIYANQRMAELVGLSRESIVGMKTADFYHDPADREVVRGILARQQQLQDYELPVRKPDGTLLWLSASMRVLPLAGETCVLGIMLDVTERRSYAQRLNSERRLLRRLLELHERDRQLIAYEIHDGFVQDVTGAILHLQASARKLHPDEAAQKDLSKGIDILRNAIDEARRLIDGLQPGVLEEQGVVEGVRYLAQQTERMNGIAVELQIDVRFDRLAPAVEQAIYRIVQEGLNNIGKHSQSTRARVVLSQRPDALVIKIEDTGVGFDPLTTKSRRYGLTGIRDRARLLGGKAKIRSAPGKGTQLRVKLPLEDVLLPDGWKQPQLSDDDSSSGVA